MDIWGVAWIHVAQDNVQLWAFVNMAMNFRVPWMKGNFLTIWTTISFSKPILFLGISQLFGYMTLNGRMIMNDELKRIGKEAVVVLFYWDG
jgi:hypothetical protein